MEDASRQAHWETVYTTKGENEVSWFQQSPAPSLEQTATQNVETEPSKPKSARQRNYTWSELMKRVFLVDVFQCERCGGRMKIIASIHPPDTTGKILECLGLPSRAPPLASAVSDFNCQMDSF